MNYTINGVLVTKVANQDSTAVNYIPVGSIGVAYGDIHGDAGYIVAWANDPYVLIPTPSNELEVGDFTTMALDPRLNAILDCYRKLPPDFEINIFK